MDIFVIFYAKNGVSKMVKVFVLLLCTVYLVHELHKWVQLVLENQTTLLSRLDRIDNKVNLLLNDKTNK